MAKHVKMAGLGKLYKRVPKGCKCLKGQAPVLVGKFGVRCMGYRRFKGERRWLFVKTPDRCNA